VKLLSETASLGQYQAAVEDAVTRMEAERVARRIWDGDHTVWKPDPTGIANRLGWLRIATAMREKLPRLRAIATSACAVDRSGPCFTRVVLLGMGGSSLAPEVLQRTFCEEGTAAPELVVMDTTNPCAVLECTERIDPARTLFIVATKSGGTVETLSLFRYFHHHLSDVLGGDRAGGHFIAITDPGSSLADLAERHGFRATFLNDPNIGGRYSALSHFGLVPGALAGVDVTRLLDRAEAMAAACSADVTAADNPGAWLGTVMGRLALAGRDKVTFVISPAIAGFGDWVEQLIAESTGKEGRGILPVVGEPLGPPEVYGDDRFFVHIRLEGDATNDAALACLAAAGHPVARLELGDPYDLGGQFFLWEMATAVAGHHLGINPFDQPNVESAKALAREMVAAYARDGALPEPAPTLADRDIGVYAEVAATSVEGAVEAFLARARPRDYVTLMAYLPPAAETSEALAAVRVALRDRLRAATTSGYGPRFLHSTGQLHKGDAGRGLFIQLTADHPRDAAIPDEGAVDHPMTFGVLHSAQALGDRQALLDTSRRVIRLHLGRDIMGGIARLRAAIV